MATNTFYLTYAQLMEQYQFIELHVEQLYAAASDKGYLDGLQDVDKSSLPSTVNAICKLETEQNRTIFTEDEYTALSHLIKRRNFWAHECFTKLSFKDSGTLKRPEDMHRMVVDLRDAEEWREKLWNKQRQY